MNQYENNVTVIMEFLKAENFSASVISMHRICYRELQEVLLFNMQVYSYEYAMNWIESNKSLWKYRKCTGFKHCLEQLEDVYKHGTIALEHLGARGSAYTLLNVELKNELDEYLENADLGKYISRHRIACSRFLLYLQKRELTSISQLNYDILLNFHGEDYHKSYKSKDVYEDLIRKFLYFQSSLDRCSLGFFLALSKLIIPHIVIIDLALLKNDFSKEYVITWTLIESFLTEMIEIGYGSTVIKSSKHILKLLHIFLDMHHIHFNKDNLWVWFEHVKPLLGSNWKQARRTLSQFWIFLVYGELTTEFTGDPFYKNPTEYLPEWMKSQLQNYLTLSKREGLKKSTIDMRRSSNLRFCRFLQLTNIKDFSKITPELLETFNQQDIHSTSEGKAAYNVRIRGFLIYLHEQGKISNPFLYKALPSVSAPRIRIISILSDDEVNEFWTLDTKTLSSKAFRDYAIMCIGLSMGFRASDIVSIQFKNINWKQPNISLTQAKTGKRINMPLPVKIGNILFRYLKIHRPKSSSSYVFIHHEVPYDKLSPSVCRSALNRFLPNRATPNKGFHVVRKTFATGLLRGNTKVGIISDALGHSTDDTVHKYLALDEERMRKCPLSLEETGITWRGGVFYA